MVRAAAKPRQVKRYARFLAGSRGAKSSSAREAARISAPAHSSTCSPSWGPQATALLKGTGTTPGIVRYHTSEPGYPGNHAVYTDTDVSIALRTRDGQ